MGPEEPTPFQIQIAEALGIEIERDTRAVAAARIHTFVGSAIQSKVAGHSATERQIAFAKDLGLDVCHDSSLLASAKIADELYVRNKAAMERLQLKPGDRVRVRFQFQFNNQPDELVQDYVVSSILPNFRIMFKGGNGNGAWPTQVERVQYNEDV